MREAWTFSISTRSVPEMVMALQPFSAHAQKPCPDDVRNEPAASAMPVWPIIRRLRTVTSSPPCRARHAPLPSWMSSTVFSGLWPSMAMAALATLTVPESRYCPGGM